MSTDALNTFGAILTFAIDLEGKLEAFYSAASDASGEEELSGRFGDYARQSAKRKNRLTTIRQENVTEMILEPITGLDVRDYTLDFEPDALRSRPIAEALRLEERAARFYTDAGPKLNVTEPRRAFQKLAKENTERLAALRQYA